MATLNQVFCLIASVDLPDQIRYFAFLHLIICQTELDMFTSLYQVSWHHCIRCMTSQKLETSYSTSGTCFHCIGYFFTRFFFLIAFSIWHHLINGYLVWSNIGLCVVRYLPRTGPNCIGYFVTLQHLLTLHLVFDHTASAILSYCLSFRCLRLMTLP